MALPNQKLIDALRTAAQQLANGAPYAWGHHGQCNCGNLAQILTPFTDQEIQKFAHQSAGEWTELAEAFCATSGAPIDLVLEKLMDAGLQPSDVQHLEYLSDKTVLKNLAGGFRWLKRNKREDVIAYFEAFAQLLEDRMLDRAVEQLAKASGELNTLAVL